MAAIKKPREVQRVVALGHLQAEELTRRIDLLIERPSALTESRNADELRRSFEGLAADARRLVGTLSEVPVGISVETAADELGVSPPTVRKWVRQGLLRPVVGRKPIEVEQGSLVDLRQAFAQVRIDYPSRDWGTALAAYLHDRDLMHQAWLQEGVAQAARGEFVDL